MEVTLEKKLVHSLEYPIRWGDMDAYGHVNNTLYFLYVQEARFAMLLDANVPVDPLGVSPVLAETTSKFIRPINFPETLLINTYLVGVKGKKVFFEHEIKSNSNHEIVYAIISATIVWFDFKNGKSSEVPDDILKKIISHKKQ
ncbi:MAG: acyl-CoA thioesterase [Neisseriaceae bacterium]|jgi:acyl-CoA thioester hydrolase